MRVTLVALSCKGGMLHYTSQFANAMSASANVTVVLPSHTDTMLFNKEITLRRVKTADNARDYIGRSILASTYASILMAIRHSEPDTVHVVTSHPWNAMILPWLARYVVACTIHDPKSHSGEGIPILRLSDWLLMRRSNVIFVHGQFWKNYLTQHRHSAEKIVAIPHGSYEFFTRWMDPGISEEAGLILFFGRLAPYKGVEVLLRAIPEIERHVQHFRVVIAGGGSLNLPDASIDSRRVEIMNHYIPEPQVAELFQRAQMVVLPYLDASQSGVIPIAYAFARPVVATTVGAVPEAVDHEVTGLLVPPDDAIALGQAIARLLVNHAERHRMGQQGLAKLRQEMGWDQIAETCYLAYSHRSVTVASDRKVSVS